MEKKQLHFLVVTYPLQGHINPALHLAKRLALNTGSYVTFSSSISAHRRMFPSLPETGSLETKDELITYIPFSDGHDDGDTGGIAGLSAYLADLDRIGPRTLSEVISVPVETQSLASYILSISLGQLRWHATMKSPQCSTGSSLPLSLPFTTYHYFNNGFGDLVKANHKDPSYLVELPGLRSYKLKHLPNFLTQSFDETDPYHCLYLLLAQLFQSKHKERISKLKPIVLINTFAELEPTELANFTEIEMVPIGPLLPMMINQNGESGNDGSLFRHDEKECLQWLDSKPERSVVYVAFGSLAFVKKEQQEELLSALENCGRPYVWVVRKDNRVEGIDFGYVKNGLVIEWCKQFKVLSHSSVGCFVTHCGWNSVLESLSCGVVMVCAPGMSEQTMNAELIEVWGVGATAERNADGVFESKELMRCLDVVMGDGEPAAKMRKMAVYWKEKAREATSKGGTSYCNMMTLVEYLENIS